MRSTIKALALGIALAVAGGIYDPAAAAETGQDELTLAQMVNQERINAGLAPLEIRGELFDSARAWSTQMAQTDTLSHDGFRAFANSMTSSNARVVGENVAWNWSLSDAHARLMASEGHRANILNPAFTAIGIGEVEINGKLFITQRFARYEPTPVKTQITKPKVAKKARTVRRARRR